MLLLVHPRFSISRSKCTAFEGDKTNSLCMHIYSLMYYIVCVCWGGWGRKLFLLGSNVSFGHWLDSLLQGFNLEKTNVAIFLAISS